LLVLLAVQTAVAATTVDKKVDCDKGDSITAAAADLAVDKNYVLHVSGTCNENVAVNDFEGITLTIIGDPSATIQGLLNSPGGQPVFFVSNSRRVTLSNLTIQTSGGVNPNDNPVGVALNLCRGCQVSNSTINTSRGGISLTDSQAIITNITVHGSAAGSTGMSVLGDSNANVVGLTATGPGIGGFGLLVDQGSRVRLGAIFPGSSFIRNYSFGIQVRAGALLEAQAQCSASSCIEVSDNVITGIQIVSGQAVLNGVNVIHNHQGIVVQNAGTLSYMGAASITTSTGAGGVGVGILVTHNSHAAIIGVPQGGTGTTDITGNAGRGVAVAHNSSVQFLGLPLSINISGNNGGTNIACDGSSLITGTNMLGPTTIICADQQGPALVIP
jgi:hypothetical protein